MSAPVLIDFESRSRADLKIVGGRRYWEDPSSEALCVVWYDTLDGSVGVWAPGQSWPHAGRVLAAHNANGFDRFAAERYEFNAAGWIDTSQLARKAGLPGALDALGVRWAGVPKDDEGSKFTRALSSVRRPTPQYGPAPDPLTIFCPKCLAQPGVACEDKKGVKRPPHKDRKAPKPLLSAGIEAAAWATLPKSQQRKLGVLPALTPEVLARVVQYCASDVMILAATWKRLAEWIPVDADVEAIDATINARGICFDHALALRLLEEDARQAKLAIEECASLVNATPAEIAAAARSPEQFCAITGTPNAQAETVEALDHPLARVRKALASIASGKLKAGLARMHADGRLRDTTLYYGAHTGRWSGKGMQLQNLPRPAKHFEDLPADTAIPYREHEGNRVVDVDAFANAVLTGMHIDADSIALLVRATLTASAGNLLVVQDFSSVEARATAWAAGDSAAVEVFLSGRDPYKVAAEAIFATPYDSVTKSQRQIGKVAELACGYGGGPNAFAQMAHTYKLGNALDGLDLRALVTAWRRLHSPIQDLWYSCERAFRAAVTRRNAWAGPFEFVSSKTCSAVACFLPSGRPIVYNEATANAEGIAYTGTKGREHIYGGKLVENAIQALCRDLMSQALLRVEEKGLNPVLTVHDEIVCDVPEVQAESAYAALHEAMVTLPSWAAGFPIGADGWIGKRYRK